MEIEMHKYLDSLVNKGRYKSKAEYVKKAISEKMKRDKKNKNVCDICHQKFKRSDDIDILIDHVEAGVEVIKSHKKCSRKRSEFDKIFAGFKVSS